MLGSPAETPVPTAQTSSAPIVHTPSSGFATPVGTSVHGPPVECAARPRSPTAHWFVRPVAATANADSGAGSVRQPKRAQVANPAEHAALHCSGPASKPRSTQVSGGGAPSHSSPPLMIPSPHLPVQPDTSQMQNGEHLRPDTS